MDRFDDVFKRLKLHEGVLSLDPNDRGNWTGGKVGVGELKGSKYGVSAAQYPHLDIRNLTIEQAREIARQDYWDPIRADQLGQPLDEFLFDYAYNSGVPRAARALQRAVGALPDGVIGPKTLAALSSRSTRDVLRLVFVDRARLFARDPARDSQDAGWFGRLFDKVETALRVTA